jgi:hypothetical protein
MPRATKIDKLTHARNVLRGLTKHYPAHGRPRIGGKPFSRAELIALFQGHLDAMQEVETARIAFVVAVAKERVLAKRVKVTTVALRAFLSNVFGPSLAVWAEFGLQLAKKPGPKTVAGKVAGVRKRQAARDAS